MKQIRRPFENAYIILKYLRGELNSSEEEAFNIWLSKNDSNKALLKSIEDEETRREELTFYASIDIEKNWQQLAEKKQPKVVKFWLQPSLLKYAAVFLVITLSIFAAYVNMSKPTATVQNHLATSKQPEIKPGKTQAKLTLADGTEIILDELGNGLLKSNDHIKISKQNGTVIYQFVGKPSAEAGLEYHTISTPRGGQYQLTLSDGTKVWLNAASTLRFPVAFTNGERKVTLTGEGYFEVAKKKQPFRVAANDITVEVLGTHFNVNAYPEDEATKTTLLEGSVKVNKADEKVILKPGFEAIAGRSDGINTSKADLDQAIAWKEGYFQFENDDFLSISIQLERWYNVEFSYPTTVKSSIFSGAIPRNTKLNQVLQMLELSGSIKFKQEGRRIMVEAKE